MVRLHSYFLVVFLLLLSACGSKDRGETTQIRTISPQQGSRSYPSIDYFCQIYPQDQNCLKRGSEIDKGTAIFNSCEEQHHLGEISYCGHQGTGIDIPITFYFLRSSAHKLSGQPELDAERAIEEMNYQFSYNGHFFLHFSLKAAVEVIDDQYSNTDCYRLYEVADKYKKREEAKNSMVMIFVNDLSGSCAGVSPLLSYPSDNFAVTLTEYRYPFKYDNFTPIIHEFAHSFGLHHTGQEYYGSVPVTGLISFNELMDIDGLSYKRCNVGFSYFIDPLPRGTETQHLGVKWNSYHNTMYPSFGGQPDLGIFTAGYNYANSWALDCWYQNAKEQIE